MNTSGSSKEKTIRRAVILLPLLAVVVSSLLPIQPVIRQGLILIILVWYQVSLMMGVFG